jgi:hypothetical protein
MNFPVWSVKTLPGRISTSCPIYKGRAVRFSLCTCDLDTSRPELKHTLNTPLKILPPATPPFNSSTVEPGLLTSKDRITINLGSASKSCLGTGILVQMYSLTASMLYFSWAEMGMMGASRATVAGNEEEQSTRFSGHVPLQMIDRS